MTEATVTNIEDHRTQQPPPKAPEPTAEDIERMRKRVRMGDKYFKLEPLLNDVLNMARLAADCLEHTIGSSHEKMTGDRDVYWIPKTTHQRLTFAVYNVQHLAEEVVSKWYEWFDEADAPEGGDDDEQD